MGEKGKKGRGVVKNWMLNNTSGPGFPFLVQKLSKLPKMSKVPEEINLFIHLLMPKVIFQLPRGEQKCNIAEDDVSTSKEWTFSTFPPEIDKFNDWG